MEWTKRNKLSRYGIEAEYAQPIQIYKRLGVTRSQYLGINDQLGPVIFTYEEMGVTKDQFFGIEEFEDNDS